MHGYRKFFYASCFTLALTASISLSGNDEYSQAINKGPYERPSTCPEDVWTAMQPYFLPYNHPIKHKLDRFCSQHRVLASKSSLEKAGFTDPESGSDTNAYVMKHPRMPGYVFKAYTDRQSINDGDRLLRRLLGAAAVQNTLDTYGFNHLIKVPKKWIYPLPPGPSAKKGSHPKHFMLVAQDVGVLSRGGNAYEWKNSMDYELLTAIYIVIQDNRMIDSIRISNIPFCYDGKVAFIDTEFFDIPESYAEIRYWKLFDYLSSEMAAYLKRLAENGLSE